MSEEVRYDGEATRRYFIFQRADDIKSLLQTIIDSDPNFGSEAYIVGDDETISSLGGDDLDARDLILAIEDQFGVEMPDDVDYLNVKIIDIAAILSRELPDDYGA